MEQSRSLPSGGTSADDVGHVIDGRGPFVTVRVGFDADVPNARQRAEATWHGLADDARERGVPEEVLEAVGEAALAERTQGRLLLVGHAGGVLDVAVDVDERAPDELRWSPLPWFAPVLAAHQHVVDHAVVVCDRTGADVTVIVGDRVLADREIGGRTDPIRKVQPGGWSQRRFQQRADNVWRANADDVEHEIERLVRGHRVQVVLLGGEERAVSLIQERLPADVAEVVYPIGATRAADGSEEEGERSMRRALNTALAERTTAWLSLLRDELGTGRAADGPRAVFEALRRSQVAVLLLGAGGGDARFDPDRPELAHLPDEAVADGGSATLSAPLADVATWTALKTGARVVAVPAAAMPEPVAALLRWS